MIQFMFDNSNGNSSNNPAAYHSSSINSILSLVSALTLDTEVTYSQKLSGLRSLSSLLGIPSLNNTPALLNPSTKSLFIYMEITKDGVSRLTLTTSRPEALPKCKALLDHSGYLEDDKTSQLSADEKCCIICPYYKSEFGKKVSEGENVEEGEGLGPRKELFAILSEAFTSDWEATVAKSSAHPLRGSGRDGFAEIQIDDDGETSSFVGHQVSVELHGSAVTRKILSKSR